MADNETLQTLKINIEATTGNAIKRIEDVKESIKGLSNALQVPQAMKFGDNTLNSRALQGYVQTFKESFAGLHNSVYQFTHGGFEESAKDVFGPLVQGAQNAVSGLKKVGQVALNAGSGFAKLTLNAGRFMASMSLVKLSNIAGRLNNIGRAFRRILTYKTIRSAIGLVVKGFSEGIKNLTEYGRIAGTVFATNMDKLASSALLVKNSVAAMASPIINEITPALEALAQRFADLANSVGMFFAKILRQPFEMATASAIKFGNAAKEAKKQIFGFDELNILNAPNGSGTSDYSGMFEKVNVEDNLTAIERQIRAAIDDSDMDLAGALFGEKFNQDIGEYNARALGERIGFKLQQAIGFASNMLDTFNFAIVGERLGDFLNGAMENINFENIGNTVAHMWTALPDMIVGFVESLDWKSVGASLNGFIVGGLNGLATWFSGVNWPKFNHDLVNGIADALEQIDWGAIASSVVQFLGTAVGGVASLLWEVGSRIVSDLKEGISGGWSGIGEWIRKNLLDPFIGGIAKGLGLGEPGAEPAEIGHQIIDSFLEGLKDAWGEVTKFYDDYVKPFVDGIKVAIDYAFNGGTNIKSSAPAQITESQTGKALDFDPFDLTYGRASGGYVPPGDLFYANERGPELIGNFSGRTEVYNQDTFVSALASAMTPVVQATMAIGTQISDAVNSKDYSAVVKIGDRDIYASAQRGAKLTGGSLITGGIR